MLEPMKLRPRDNRQSRANASSVYGGIFGTDHHRSPYIPMVPNGVHGRATCMYPGAPTSSAPGDFLSRVEQAERRDTAQMQHVTTMDHQRQHDALAYQRQQVREQQYRGGLVFGDDSTPQQLAASRHQTTNSLNEAQMRTFKREEGDRVLTLSHFLPRRELPFSTCVPEMAKAVGCLELDEQIDAVDADVHVYGHTHINGDSDAFPHLRPRRRYVQYALEGGGRNLYCVWDRGHAASKEVRAT